MSKKVNFTNCKQPQWGDDDFDLKSVDPTEPSNVTKELNRLQDVFKTANSHTAGDAIAQKAVDEFFTDARKIGEIALGTVYEPSYYNRLQSKAVGILGGVGKLSDNLKNMSPKQILMSLERHSRGKVADVFDNLDVASKARQFDVHVRRTLGEANLRTLDPKKVTYRLLEAAELPYLVEASGKLNPAAKMIVERRQRETLTWLTKAGLDTDQIDSIYGSAKRLVQSKQETKLLMEASGYDLRLMLDEDYLSRVLTPQSERLLKRVLEDKVSEGVNASLKNNPQAWLKNSTEFNLFTPGDVDTLDFLLKKSGVFDRINDTADDNLKALLGGQRINSVTDVFRDGKDPILNEAFINKLSPKELDFLMDTGLIDKIPLSSTSVVERIRDVYKLPFDGVDDVFKVNPEEGVKVYKDHLEALAVKEGRILGLIDGGINYFGVPESVAKSSDEFKGFVSLDEGIPTNLLKRISDNNPEILDRLTKVYVSPDVARASRAALEIQTSPMYLGLIGETLRTVRSVYQGLMLFTPQWVNRNILGNTGMLYQWGVNPHNYLGHLLNSVYGSTISLARNIKEGKFGNIKHIKIFDYGEYLTDKKILGGGKISPRDLWKAGVQAGQISNFNALSDGSKRLSLDLNSAKRTMKEIIYMGKNAPVDESLKELVKRGEEGIQAIADSFMFNWQSQVNAHMDNAAKFALAEQLLSDRRITRQIMGGSDFLDALPKVKNAGEAWDWVAKHYPQFDDLPTNQRWYQIASSSQPFFAFQLRNYGVTARMLMENPHRFGSFLKLTSDAKDEFRDEFPDEHKLMQAPWMSPGNLTVPMRIPAAVSGTGRDEFFNFPTTTIFSTFAPVEDVNAMLDILGVFNDSKPPNKRPDNPFLDERRKKEYSPLRKALSNIRTDINSVPSLILSAVDFAEGWKERSESGRTYSLFGVEVDANIHYAITELIPNTRSLDKLFQVTGLGGESIYVDPVSGETNKPVKSIFGTTPDYPTQSQNPRFTGNTVADVILQIVGIHPSYVDVYTQQGYTLGEVEGQISESKRVIGGLRKKLLYATTPNEKKAIGKQLTQAIAFTVELGTEHEVLKEFSKEEGITSSKALRMMRQKGLRIQDVVGEDEFKNRMNDYWDRLQQSPEWNPNLEEDKVIDMKAIGEGNAKGQRKTLNQLLDMKR